MFARASRGRKRSGEERRRERELHSDAIRHATHRTCLSHGSAVLTLIPIGSIQKRRAAPTVIAHGEVKVEVPVHNRVVWPSSHQSARHSALSTFRFNLGVDPSPPYCRRRAGSEFSHGYRFQEDLHDTVNHITARFSPCLETTSKTTSVLESQHTVLNTSPIVQTPRVLRVLLGVTDTATREISTTGSLAACKTWAVYGAGQCQTNIHAQPPPRGRLLWSLSPTC